MSKETFYLGLSHFLIKVYKILRLARKISPRHLKCCTCRMGSACPKIKNDDGFTNLWTLSKRHPNSPNTVPATKNDLQKPPVVLAEACQRFRCFSNVQKCHACHMDEKVSDVLRLSRKTTFQTSNACHAKWT